MELLLQALDELDDLVVGLRLASMPWVASLLQGGRLGLERLRPAADALGDAVERLDPRAGLLYSAADAVQAPALDLPPLSGRGDRSVRNVTE